MAHGYFSGSRYIAKGLPLSAAERSAIAEDAQLRLLRYGFNGLWAFLVVVALLGAVIAGVMILRWAHRSHGWPDLNFPFLMMMCVGSVVGLTAWRERRLAPFVYSALRDRGHDVCPRCGYVRAGLDEAAPCPECGTLPAANLL